MADWKQNLVERDGDVADIVRASKRIAVLGIRPDTDAHKPSHSVPAYLQKAGYEVLPVPVKGAGEGTILGQPSYARVADVPGPVDIVDVFRKPEDIDAHVDDIIAKKPKVAWFQLGIRNDAAAEKLARAGIRVVQDRCLKIEHGRAGR